MSRFALCVFVLACARSARNRGKDMRPDDFSPYSQTQVSVHGCECLSECKAGAADYFRCDTCKVDRSCKKREWRLSKGRYDYCAYAQVESWEKENAWTKADHLWELIKNNGAKDGAPSGVLGTVKNVLTQSMRPPFDNERDIVTKGRIKAMHSMGVVCRVDMNISSTLYSGFLGKGKHSGFLRMGSAAPVALGILPGMALKFMRSGMLSANFFAVRKEGDSPNFLNGALTNHVAPPALLVALQKFQQASDCSGMVGLSESCKYNSAGRHVSALKFPFEVVFNATNPNLIRGDPDAVDKDQDYLNKLEGIRPWTKLFAVSGVASPGANPVHLGYVTTTSECIKGGFGDTQLHFHHQRVEEDFALEPKWLDQLKASGFEMNGCIPGKKPSETWICGKDGEPEKTPLE